ncbi:MAG: hypothetical protein K9L75_04240 [Spirochaetia bacterium]|nr:hypothetical protein [Spirochaetia bacterium]
MRWTEKTLDTVKTFIQQHIDPYLQQIRDETGEELPALTSISIGQDYTKRGRMKPFVLIDPMLLTPDDEAQGVIGGSYNIDLLIAVDGYTDEITSRRAMRYADALADCIFDYDSLDGQVYHARINNIEYFPGGTGTEKYVLISISVMQEMNRG